MSSQQAAIAVIIVFVLIFHAHQRHPVRHLICNPQTIVGELQTIWYAIRRSKLVLYFDFHEASYNVKKLRGNWIIPLAINIVVKYLPEGFAFTPNCTVIHAL